MGGVTGATGVLGKILCSKLLEKNIQYSEYKGDIRDEKELFNWIKKSNITYIVHLASKVAVSDVNENIAEAYDVNISGTINLIKCISKYDKPVGFFYASTSHVYKSSLNKINEENEIKPINSYGLTKRISEEILLDFQDKCSNFSLCIGRIFSFYHESQKPPFLYPNLQNRFRTEDLTKPFKLFGAQSTRDFLKAEEVCDIIIKLMVKKYKGIVNIASGKPIKIIDFVASIAPVALNFEYDINEQETHLNADISLLKNILNE